MRARTAAAQLLENNYNSHELHTDATMVTQEAAQSRLSEPQQVVRQLHVAPLQHSRVNVSRRHRVRLEVMERIHAADLII